MSKPQLPKPQKMLGLNGVLTNKNGGLPWEYPGNIRGII
jgi:hypothetical protein